MSVYYNPGCALSLYKPEMEVEIFECLQQIMPEIQMHKICCRHEPNVGDDAHIINTCAGCDRRFRALYDGVTTTSLWEIIDQADGFVFPDYKGIKMTVHDACPVREKPQVHLAVRSLLRKMNIEVVEAEASGTRSICCGDDFYGKIPLEQIHELMQKRADTMPCEDVCVYCVSCVKSMAIGGKTPRYLVDLLFNEQTSQENKETEAWHNQLELYIEAH